MKLYNGDCLEIMKTMEDNSIDITITSPPYNLGNRHETHHQFHYPYPDEKKEDIYQNEQINVLNEIYRITKETGSLFYNHKNRIVDKQSLSPYKWIFKSNWLVKQEIVWNNGSPNFNPVRFFPQTERVYWLVKNKNTVLKNVISHNDIFTRKEWKPVGRKGKHSRAFPEKLVEDILICFEDSKTVLDTYMGSGTTGVVAQRMNKQFIGIELNTEYYELAKRRINEDRSR